MASALMGLLGGGAGRGTVQSSPVFSSGVGWACLCRGGERAKGLCLSQTAASVCVWTGPFPGQTRRQNSGLEVFLPEPISGFGLDVLVRVLFHWFVHSFIHAINISLKTERVQDD